MGVFRHTDKIHPKEIEHNTISTYKEIQTQLDMLIGDHNFLKIINNFYCKEIYRTLNCFKVAVPKYLLIKHYFINFYLNSVLKKVFLKLKKI